MKESKIFEDGPIVVTTHRILAGKNVIDLTQDYDMQNKMDFPILATVLVPLGAAIFGLFLGVIFIGSEYGGILSTILFFFGIAYVVKRWRGRLPGLYFYRSDGELVGIVPARVSGSFDQLIAAIHRAHIVRKRIASEDLQDEINNLPPARL